MEKIKYVKNNFNNNFIPIKIIKSMKIIKNLIKFHYEKKLFFFLKNFRLKKNFLFYSKENTNLTINQMSIINMSLVLNELEKEIEKENLNETKTKIFLEKILLIKTKKKILFETKKKNKMKINKYFKKWKYQIFKKFYKELIFSIELKSKINNYKILNLFLKEKINFLKKNAIFCENCKKFETKFINNIIKKKIFLNQNQNDDDDDLIDEDYVDYLDSQLNKSKENIQNLFNDKNFLIENLKNIIKSILKEIKKNYKKQINSLN